VATAQVRKHAAPGERGRRLARVAASGELGDQAAGDARVDQRVAGGDDFDPPKPRVRRAISRPITRLG
jgi:hypothetical protein